MSNFQVIDVDPDSLSPTDTNSKIITGQGTTSRVGTPGAKEMELRHQQSTDQLLSILDIYDLPRRVISWASFPEDQFRFNNALIGW